MVVLLLNQENLKRKKEIKNKFYNILKEGSVLKRKKNILSTDAVNCANLEKKYDKLLNQEQDFDKLATSYEEGASLKQKKAEQLMQKAGIPSNDITTIMDEIKVSSDSLAEQLVNGINVKENDYSVYEKGFLKDAIAEEIAVEGTKKDFKKYYYCPSMCNNKVNPTNTCRGVNDGCSFKTALESIKVGPKVFICFWKSLNKQASSLLFSKAKEEAQTQIVAIEEAISINCPAFKLKKFKKRK